MSIQRSCVLLVMLALAACRTNALYQEPRDGGSLDGAPGDGAATDLRKVSGCQGRDETSCRNASGCVADTCQQCSCTPSFVGCRGVGDAPTPCPELGCPQPFCCRSSDECSGSGAGFCQVPPIHPGCGACFIGPSECDDDVDCKSLGASFICKDHPCSCSNGIVNSCQRGCTLDADCPEPDRCGAQHRCEPRSCSDPVCTGNYACAASICVRKPCTQDVQCTGGYCVEGLCSRSLGQCVQPAA